MDPDPIHKNVIFPENTITSQQITAPEKYCTLTYNVSTAGGIFRAPDYIVLVNLYFTPILEFLEPIRGVLENIIIKLFVVKV